MFKNAFLIKNVYYNYETHSSLIFLNFNMSIKVKAKLMQIFQSYHDRLSAFTSVTICILSVLKCDKKLGCGFATDP